MSARRLRRKPGENRARLLEAGLHEFGLFGYYGASTGAIAARAGVPQPHLYANFGSKLELFAACLSGVGDRCASAAPRSLSSAEACLYLQAITVLANPELSSELRPIVEALHRFLPPAERTAALKLGAHKLLTTTIAKDTPDD